MNRENALKLIEALKTESELTKGFDMSEWLNSCDTAGCIAGCAYTLAEGIDPNVSLTAARWLELTKEQRDALFLPNALVYRQRNGVLDDPWEDCENPIMLTGPEGALRAARAVERALELWG